MSGSAADTTTGVSLGGSTATSVSGSDGNTQTQTTTTGAAQTTGSSGQQQQQQSASPFDSLADQGLKQLATDKGWKTIDDTLKSYKELETKLSSTSAARKAPASATEYKFDVPAEVKATYNEDLANWLKTTSHKLGLTQEEASTFHNEFVGYAKSFHEAQAQAQSEALATSVKNAVGELSTEWKSQPGTPAFTRNVELAKRAIRMAGPGVMDALEKSGVVVKVDGQLMVANAPLFSAFAKMGSGMYSEDSVFGEPASDKNPFDAKTEDRAMQGRLIKEDPDRAALLIKAAGQEKLFKQFLERHGSGRR